MLQVTVKLIFHISPGSFLFFFKSNFNAVHPAWIVMRKLSARMLWRMWPLQRRIQMTALFDCLCRLYGGIQDNSRGPEHQKILSWVKCIRLFKVGLIWLKCLKKNGNATMWRDMWESFSNLGSLIAKISSLNSHRFSLKTSRLNPLQQIWIWPDQSAPFESRCTS